MREVKIPEKADLRKVVATLHSIVDRDKHLLAAAEELSKIHDANSIVAAATVRLAEIETQIGKQQERVAAENAAADAAVAAAQHRVTEAEQQAAAALAALKERYAGKSAAAEAETNAAIATCRQGQTKAEANLADVERRLAQATARLEAAEAQRSKMRTELEAVQGQL